MVKFKAPFSSQRSQDDPDRRTDRSVPNTTLSPLHIGRVGVITPQTKIKIKRRFAGLAKQQHHGIKSTSPGVSVPFDLSQSQSVISQPLKSTAHGLTGIVLDMQGDFDHNETPVDNCHTHTTDESQSHPELYIDIGEEDDDSQIQNVEGRKIEDVAPNSPVFSDDVDKNDGIENSKNPHCTKLGSRINSIPVGQKNMNPGIVKRKNHKQTKPKKKKISRTVHFNDDVPDEENWCGSYNSNLKVIHYLSSLPQAKTKAKKRTNKVQLKKDVLGIIFKMHREIETLKRRRTKLLQDCCYELFTVNKQRRLWSGDSSRNSLIMEKDLHQRHIKGHQILAEGILSAEGFRETVHFGGERVK